MLKNISKLECKVNERTFQFLCDSDSPLSEVKEALFQFMKFSGDVEDRVRSEQEALKIKEDMVSQEAPILEKKPE